MFGRQDAEDGDGARRRRNRRRLAFGTAVGVVGSAGVAFLLLRKGVDTDFVEDGLSSSRSPLQLQHFVSGHDRTLPNGATVPVRPYLRGPRDALIKTDALIRPDQLGSIARDIEGVQLEIPDAFLAAA